MRVWFFLRSWPSGGLWNGIVPFHRVLSVVALSSVWARQMISWCFLVLWPPSARWAGSRVPVAVWALEWFCAGHNAYSPSWRWGNNTSGKSCRAVDICNRARSCDLGHQSPCWCHSCLASQLFPACLQKQGVLMALRLVQSLHPRNAAVRDMLYPQNYQNKTWLSR